MVRPLTFASLLLLAGLFALITGCATSSDSLPSRTADRSDPISVLAVGDSLMVGAESQLADSQPGIVIDAKEGRSFSTGIDVLETHLATTTPDVVVFALGTNNGATPDQIAAVMDLASDVDEVVFVNVVVPRTWQTATNLAMLEAAASYTNASIADWYAESNEADELFRSDGYHLSSSGVERWVTLIIDATQS
jgi:lysophospholipase L1-like esterase